MERLTSTMPDGLNVIGDLHCSNGFAQAFRQNVEAIRLLGIETAYTEVPMSTLARTVAFDEPPKGGSYPINYVHLIGTELTASTIQRLPPGLLEQRYNIGYWIYDLPKLPDSWLHAFKYLDEIWTATQFAQENIQLVAPVPVYLIPHVVTVHPDPGLTRRDFDLPEQRYIFLYTFNIYSTIARKNPFGVIEAYKRAFAQLSEPEMPMLVLKAHYLDRDPVLHSRFEAEIDGLPIRIFTEDWSRRQTDSLLACCDSFVSLHRAEGFGFGLAEAMLLGKPVIGTGWSGNMQFMNEANSYLVPYEIVPVSEAHHRYQQHQPNLEYPARFSVWAEPDVDEAARIMLEVFTKRQAAAQRGQVAAQYIRTNYSVEAISRLIGQRLSQIDPGRRSSHRTSQRVHTPQSRIRIDFGGGIDGGGWDNPEVYNGQRFRWMINPVATLDASVLRGHDFAVSFHVPIWMSQDILDSLQVHVNGYAIAVSRAEDPKGGYQYRGVIAAEFLSDTTTLEFSIKEVITSRQAGQSNDDPRSLGLAFSWLRLEPMAVRSTTGARLLDGQVAPPDPYALLAALESLQSRAAEPAPVWRLPVLRSLYGFWFQYRNRHEVSALQQQIWRLLIDRSETHSADYYRLQGLLDDLSDETARLEADIGTEISHAQVKLDNELNRMEALLQELRGKIAGTTSAEVAQTMAQVLQISADLAELRKSAVANTMAVQLSLSTLDSKVELLRKENSRAES